MSVVETPLRKEKDPVMRHLPLPVQKVILSLNASRPMRFQTMAHIPAPEFLAFSHTEAIEPATTAAGSTPVYN